MPDDALTIPQVSKYLNGESLDVIEEIAPDDPMYRYDPTIYFRAGQSALRNIRLAMLAAELESVGSLLDFACGRGRVLRTLKAAFPEADLTACDLEAAGVEFCTRVLGARGVLSHSNPAQVQLPGPFDAIWCGSLLTHVDSDKFTGFLKVFEEVLATGGVAVFTVYGRYTAQGLRDGTLPLDLTKDQAAGVLRDYEESGFGFYPGFAPEINFGDSLASRAWVCKTLEQTPRLKLLLYIEDGWLGQDVVACTTREV